VKFTEAIDPNCQQRNCSPWSLLLGNMWFMGDHECYLCGSWVLIL